MKTYIITLLALFCITSVFSQKGEATVEAEFDTTYHFKFVPIIDGEKKSILIDEGHNTIYSLSYGKETAREMLDIMKKDGNEVNFTAELLDSVGLASFNPAMLIIHGIPNNKVVLGAGENEEIFYQSPLKDSEVEAVTKYIHQGGSLFLFLSHFPNGSGALPLLEALGVKFRDGYAYQPKSPGHNCSLCSHFIMTPENEMIKTDHPVIANGEKANLVPDTVKFLCGAAVFRNPEDVILGFPNNTMNFTPTSAGNPSVEESSDSYAGMIGFEYGEGRVIICTDQGIFRSIDLLLDNDTIPVTIHDPECDNAELFLDCIRWLKK